MNTAELQAYRQPRKHPMKSGWICLLIAIGAVLLLGPLGFIIAGPLTLAAFILSIVGLAKDNTGGGIALLLSSLFLPGLAFLLWLLIGGLILSLRNPKPDAIMDRILESKTIH